MTRKITIALVAGALTAAIAGCSHDSAPQDPVSQQHAAISQRASEIAARTHGDWSQLTPDERDYYVKTVGGGNLVSAQLSLRVLAGKGMPSGPGGPPGPNAAPAGAPGAPPANFKGAGK
ncbi:MAG TPA: hypothetical protein VFW40_04530 [Capsulimonadaceae bacterium]|nr:hypothetical protein [Capsulimonadaceae bacterium]